MLPDEDELKVGRVFFEGNRALDDDVLLERLWITRRPWSVWGEPSDFDRKQLEDDLVRIANVYKRAGYHEARVVAVTFTVRPGGKLVDIGFAVEEGRPVRVVRKSSIVYPGGAADEVAAIERINPVKIGDVFSVALFERARSVIRANLRNRGYYAAEVTPESWIDARAYAADTTFTIAAGPRVRFGPTVISGYGEVERHLIRREINWREGAWYDESLVEETIQDLYALNLFRNVRVAPRYAGGATDPMPMIIQVAGAPWQSLRFGFGYGSEDRLRVQSRYNHYNLLGGTRRLDLLLRVSLLTRRAEATITQPHVFSKRNQFALTTAYRWQVVVHAFSYERYTLLPRITRRFTRHWAASLGYQLEYNRAFDVVAGIPLENRSSADPGILSAAVGMVERTTVNSLLFPTHGNVARITGMHAGRQLGGRFDFYKLTLESQQYLNPWRRLVFVLRGKAGVAEPFTGSRVPLYERFYSGGTHSVRGYRLDRLGPQIGGYSLVEGSFEVRRRTYGPLWFAAFYDVGMVALDPYAWASNQVRAGVGPGLRATTLIGLIQADLGIPLAPRVDEPTWRFHLSIGQAF